MSGPCGIAVTSSGHLYVTDKEAGSVHVLQAPASDHSISLLDDSIVVDESKSPRRVPAEASRSDSRSAIGGSSGAPGGPVTPVPAAAVSGHAGPVAAAAGSKSRPPRSPPKASPGSPSRHHTATSGPLGGATGPGRAHHTHGQPQPQQQPQQQPQLHAAPAHEHGHGHGEQRGSNGGAVSATALEHADVGGSELEDAVEGEGTFLDVSVSASFAESEVYADTEADAAAAYTDDPDEGDNSLLKEFGAYEESARAGSRNRRAFSDDEKEDESPVGGGAQAAPVGGALGAGTCDGGGAAPPVLPPSMFVGRAHVDGRCLVQAVQSMVLSDYGHGDAASVAPGPDHGAGRGGVAAPRRSLEPAVPVHPAVDEEHGHNDGAASEESDTDDVAESADSGLDTDAEEALAEVWPFAHRAAPVVAKGHPRMHAVPPLFEGAGGRRGALAPYRLPSEPAAPAVCRHAPCSPCPFAVVARPCLRACPPPLLLCVHLCCGDRVLPPPPPPPPPPHLAPCAFAGRWPSCV
jgi:hypothetical protein